MPSALRSRVPAKITSCMWVPRRLLALCSPRTQLTPSRMFDLPHPFGPTTTAMPVPDTVSSVRSQKLLNPRMWIFFSFSIFDSGTLCAATARAAALPAKHGGNGRLSTDFTETERQGQRWKVRNLWIRRGGISRLQKPVDYPVLFGISTGFIPFFHKVKPLLAPLRAPAGE